MTRRTASLVAVVALSLLGSALPSTASAADAPAWQLTLMSAPTNFTPGGAGTYTLFASNTGAAPTSGTTTIHDTLPAGLTPQFGILSGAGIEGECEFFFQQVFCETTSVVYPGMVPVLNLRVKVASTFNPGDTVVDRATIEDEGGAFGEASTTTTISSTPAPFNFLADPAGLGTTMVGPDGQAATQAGSHPYELNVNLNFANTSNALNQLFGADGGVRDANSYLPRGLIVDPAATPVRCTEVQFEGFSCPDASAIGLADTKLPVGIFVGFSTDSLYNMVAPPGSPSSFGFVAAGAGVYIHVLGGVRAGDYALVGGVRDIPSVAGFPLVGSALQLWGDPSSPAHDHVRGDCAYEESSTCPVDPHNTPLLSAPTACGGTLGIEGETDSWGHPGEMRHVVSEMTDQNGNPSGISGCASVPFAPSLEARPTTNVADSPSGLDADVHVPQSADLNTLATAHLKKAVVTLPPGLVLNPSSANGLGSCTPSQIGLDPVSNSVQLVRLDAHDGSFTVGFEGNATGPLPPNASAEEVQGALESLPGLGAGELSVDGVPGGPFRVEFTGARAGQAVPSLSAEGSTTAAQKVAVNATAGAFTITYGASTTTDIPATATAAEVRSAIDALPSVTSAGGSVMVAGGPGNFGATKPFLVTFDGGAFAGTEQSLSAASSAGNPLTGGGASVTVTTVSAGGQPFGVNVTTFVEPGQIRFDGQHPTCPDSSIVGRVEVDTPLLDNPLPGAVYIATPHQNPFGSLLAIYISVDDPVSGTLIKLAGHVEADPQTGQLSTTFDENPQLPFEDFKLHFFGGAGGVLRTPATCGEYSTTSQMTPWSANPPATPHDDYAISQAPGGGTCPTGSGSEPNAPFFDAGTVSPIAGAYSPMVVNLRRNDGSQEFSSVTLTPPPGLVGKLAGIPYCPESALKAAEQKTGNEEKANPSCPAASKVGTVTVGAGAGPAPYYTTGSAYLTGPYKGAPLSLAIVTPAAAGPYDLGTVVVRTALNLNPETAQITAVSDPIPHILQGIPLDVRSIQVKLDRNQFTLNGTSCNPFAFTGTELSVLGQGAGLSSRFQLGECAPLPFKPKLSFRLKGKTNRGGDPAFSATLQMPPGSANIAAAKVALPRSEFLDNAHIGTVCTRVQFNEGGGHGEHCPAASIYGFAKASTPLLDQPVEGPVFLRSSEHELPDLVASLRGQISVDLDGRIDSVNGGIRNSFEIVPDAPVTSFTLTMEGGAKGLLENSTNICRGTHRATVEFTAQNGKVADLSPALKNSKCAHAKKHKRHKRRHRAHRASGR
jgi:uncharacterized repeat protein (TIGR01451 family)